jgi:hypothetical protein
MEALNKKEREKAVFDFSILFVITVAIAVALLVLAFKLPAKINKENNKTIKRYDENKKELNKLSIKVDSLISLIHLSKSSSNINNAVNNNNIAALLSEFDNKAKDTSNNNSKFYNQFSIILKELKDQVADNKSLSGDDCSKKLEETKRELKEAKDESDKYKDKYDQLIIQMKN